MFSLHVMYWVTYSDIQYVALPGLRYHKSFKYLDTQELCCKLKLSHRTKKNNNNDLVCEARCLIIVWTLMLDSILHCMASLKGLV